METLTHPKEMVKDGSFAEKRTQALQQLRMSNIDPPIRDIIKDLKRLRHCFTVQSCHGHLIKQNKAGEIVQRIDPVALGLPETGLYQIAYLTLVLENSQAGRQLFQYLSDISLLDDQYFQFGSADWFWNSQGFFNSYVIQVAPYRYRHQDRFCMDCKEAVRWLDARDVFFEEIRKWLDNLLE